MHLPRKSQIKFLIQIFILFNFCLLTISLCSPFYAGLEILFPLNICISCGCDRYDKFCPFYKSVWMMRNIIHFYNLANQVRCSSLSLSTPPPPFSFFSLTYCCHVCQDHCVCRYSQFCNFIKIKENIKSVSQINKVLQ